MGRTFYLASCEHKWQLTIDNKIVRTSKQQDVREMWIQQLLFLWSIRTQVLGISAYMNPACALIFGACLYYHDIEEVLQFQCGFNFSRLTIFASPSSPHVFAKKSIWTL